MRLNEISTLLQASAWSGHVWIVDSKVLYCRAPERHSQRANEWIRVVRPSNLALAHSDGEFHENAEIRGIEVIARPKLDLSGTPKDVSWAWTTHAIAQETSRKYRQRIVTHGWDYLIHLEGDVAITQSLVEALSALKTTRNMLMKYLEVSVKPIHDERHAKVEEWYREESGRRGAGAGFDTLVPHDEPEGSAGPSTA
ncbi:MAG: hypothetical protein HYR85_10375 [Planctomycetes bacterium]|nr:hypothetical protein [Planctomycetota bacterium]MBI3847155.1 hypothetical protein [Planctomycetota bacterium]